MADWNPWHGCHKFSAGCKNCYVYRTDAKHDKDSSIVSKNAAFELPLKKKRDGSWKIPSGDLVWTCFTSDFLLEDADEWRVEAWDMMRLRRDITFLFITKRIYRLNECLPPDWGNGYPNVHIYCTMEDQEAVNLRMPILKAAPIAVKGIILEPLLEAVDLSPCFGDWAAKVVAGGESGENARECRYEWILDISRQCADAQVPFVFKQTGANFIKDGKRYRIPRRLQHSQAKKAGLDTGSINSADIRPD